VNPRRDANHQAPDAHGPRSRGAHHAALLLCAALASCAGATSTPTAAPATAPPAARPTSTPSPAPATERPAIDATPTLVVGTYRNPVLDRDFPDPDVLQVGDMVYAYATNGNGQNVQVARSAGLVEWVPLPDAMPQLPVWAVQDFGWTWAPDVAPVGEAQGYVLYFTTRLAIGQGGIQCIGLATAPEPGGPFEPQGDGPFVCQQNRGGSIDAATFIDDDGTRYLLWKNDGNAAGGRSAIHIQRLSADGLALEGEPVELISAGQAWEGILVEGPTLWQHEGRYYLFYSANDFASPRYAVGYAAAAEPLGPYTKAEEPLLATDFEALVIGPGGQDVVAHPGGETWILFHDWAPAGYRHLNLVPLAWQDGRPAVQLGAGPWPLPEPAAEE
jgi:arabinan endo-1,5-alpha-L-arabinosidase